MNKIQECAASFLNLANTTSYIFHLANRKVRVISLNFDRKDFHHLAGLQYLTDISIPKNKKDTISWILDKNKPVSDEYLAKSKFCKGKPDEDNYIRIYSPKNGPRNNSLIQCDYIIESQLKGAQTTVYIFLKHRCGSGSPCGIISFGVKKNVSYGGQNLYWMLKDKIINGTRLTIYQHPKYTIEQKLKNESLYFSDGEIEMENPKNKH